MHRNMEAKKRSTGNKIYLGAPFNIYFKLMATGEKNNSK